MVIVGGPAQHRSGEMLCGGRPPHRRVVIRTARVSVFRAVRTPTCSSASVTMEIALISGPSAHVDTALPNEEGGEFLLGVAGQGLQAKLGHRKRSKTASHSSTFIAAPGSRRSASLFIRAVPIEVQR